MQVSRKTLWAENYFIVVVNRVICYTVEKRGGTNDSYGENRLPAGRGGI